MARTLDQIISELDASYNPQRQAVQTQLAALPAQADAEISGLKATQDQAFGDIVNGARDRGLGFSGIPVADQAKYTSTNFLPAVAKVRQAQNQSKQSLYDALNNINLDQNKYAQGINQQELARDEQTRQFNETLAEQRRQTAANQAGLSGLFGGGQQNNQQQDSQADPYASVNKQGATNAVLGLLNTNDPGTVSRTIAAIKDSAGRGNAYDKFKLELIDSYANNTQYGNLLSRASSFKPGASTGRSASVQVRAPDPNLYKGSVSPLGLR